MGKGGGRSVVRLFRMFSKQTSNAESACDVNAYLFSPTTSLGLP